MVLKSSFFAGNLKLSVYVYSTTLSSISQVKAAHINVIIIKKAFFKWFYQILKN